MENSSSSSSSQRGGRELQGPRPALLKVRKDSHKIRRHPPQQQKQPVQQVRPPRIIYTVSPKVVHANPAEFMSVVQRLTGRSGPPCSTAPQTQPSFPFHLQAAWPPLDGASQHSPAARLAAIEQAAAEKSAGDGADGGHGASLPPLPGSLPASFFSPPAGAMGELMNPAGPFVGATAAAPSPSPTPDAYYSWDLLNNINMH
ncbi:hypothetical protein ABZP36_025718 [Zizania latifolia]